MRTHEEVPGSGETGRGPESESRQHREGTESPCETGGEVGLVTTRHASMMAITAFAMGTLVTRMIPAMIRDLKEWHRELWPGKGMEKPTEQPGKQQSVA